MPKRRNSESEPSLSEMTQPTQAKAPRRFASAGERKTPAKRRTEKVLPVAAAAVLPESAVTHEAIAKLAHSYWEARRSPQGSAEDDWFRAERELRGLLAPGT